MTNGLWARHSLIEAPIMSPGGEILDLIDDAAHLVDEYLRHYALEFDLNVAQLICLLCLKHNPGITLAELARFRAEDCLSIRRRLDRLANREMIERRPRSPGDRTQGFYVTAAAAQPVERALHYMNSVEVEMTERVGEIRYALLHSTLSAFIDRLNTAPSMGGTFWE